MCIQEGKFCSMGKSDMSMAFRNVPLKKCEWAILVLKAVHPRTGVVYFFCDKCLPFGSSISCAIFQEVSDAIAYLVYVKTLKRNVNYLDDYFFAALLKVNCDGQLKVFLFICEQINFPVSMEKTFWGTTRLMFLGLLLDSENQVVCIPEEKVSKALDLVEDFLNKNKKKVTIHQLQQLCGLLNFLCRCVVPGRAFTQRLYAHMEGKNLLPHHHIRITEEMKLDLLVWEKFLSFPGIFCHPFIDFKEWDASEINLYSDASHHFEKGFGAYCEQQWTFGVWNKPFMEAKEPSIEYLELFGVTVAVLLWIHKFQNKRVVLFCDNESAVHMINNSSSKCRNCMVLIRIITAHSLMNNVRVFARHVRTQANGIADSLSRLQFRRFRWLAPNMDDFSMDIPQEVWPLEKIWKD